MIKKEGHTHQARDRGKGGEIAKKAVLGCEGRAMSAKESTPARLRSLSRSALGILVRLPGFRSSGSSSPPRSPTHTALPSVRHTGAYDTLIPDLVTDM